MGGDHDPMSVKKNVYIEGIANYRDQMHLRFWKILSRRNPLPFIVAAGLIPATVWIGGAVVDQQVADRKANFNKLYKVPDVRKPHYQGKQ